jgi:glycosyltransferase involved in cell wall biosynthesis
MRVLLAQSAHSAGSIHYRITEPAREIRKAGIDVITRTGIRTTMRRPSDDAEPVIVDVDTEGADVVVLQLPKTAEMLQILRILQGKGVAVVVEMDDLLSAVPPGHMAHRTLVQKGMARAALECTREADLVTTSTPSLLKEYAPQGRGVVVPNAIARELAELPPAYERSPEVVIVGWSGNVLGHPYDLQEMGSGLRQALDRTRGRAKFVVFGQKWDAWSRLGLAEDPEEILWVKDTHAYLALMGQVFDIWIAPLRMDRFNECKSWLKPLEYSARGVYCVRARTPEYERLGLGLPARAPKDWAKWIATGVEDPDRRRELAAAAHQKVLAGHLTEHTAERWVAAWKKALDNSAKRRGAGHPTAGLTPAAH